MPHKVVMIVDDNEIDRYIAHKAVLKANFAERAICVESALEGLNYIKDNLNSPDNLPHIIFLDINMPEMNGFDFLKEYELFPDNVKRNCIIMMLTTSLDSTDRKLAMDNKYVSMFLNKPLNQEKLSKI